MKLDDLRSIDQLRDFLEGTQDVAFAVLTGKDERYRWMQQTLIKFRYRRLSKADKGIVIRYLMKMSGYSRQQATRLIGQYIDCGQLRRRQCTVRGFHRRYTDEDVALLVEVDGLHDTPNGLAVKKLCERAWRVHGDLRYRRLAQISVSHIYNLRKSKGYMSRRRTHAKTRAHKVRIGERRKPQPKGHPGYLRVDTVHQGDWDGHKGVYHINAVDQVTQFEAVVSVQQISERYLIPALQQLFDILPFEVLGFHSDNGCEYVNYRVAELLEKLRIEFTKSRARHSNDNALVECKNGHVLRKLLGHAHIPRQCAAELNEFHQRHLNRYVNYHRPCLFAQVEMDERGRQQRRYRYEDVHTPYEKLKSLPDAEQYLKVGVTFEKLDAFAVRYSDNEAADRLRAARRKLFYSIDELQRTQA